MVTEPNDFAIHDEVRVELEMAGEPVTLLTTVTNVLPEQLWLAIKTPDPRLTAVGAGQCLHLTFGRGGGALVVESQFLRSLGDPAKLGMEKSRLFAVRKPQEVEQLQRRAHVRADVERQVRIRSFGAISDDRVWRGQTLNVGAGGLQLLTEMPLMFGDQVGLLLVLTPRDVIHAGGPVVRIDEVPAPPEQGSDPAAPPRTLTRVAIRFDKISEADQERITCHLLADHRRRASVGKVALEETAAADAAASMLAAPAGDAGSAEPTTAEPPTAEPTTAEPPTAEPTTAEPTTAEQASEQAPEPMDDSQPA